MKPALCKAIAIALLICLAKCPNAQAILQTPNVESKLYIGPGDKQPLIVGLGGSEGGNAWASSHWKDIRDKFIEKGYAFLAVKYFGGNGTPDSLDRIRISDVHKAIEEAIKNDKIDKNKIAIVGGSRGGDLALLIASYYKDIHCVVAIVPANVVFPANTMGFATPAWVYKNKPLKFVPVNNEAVLFLMKRNLRGAFDAMLKDSVAVAQSLIKVENIHGPILLLSATKDEISPSTPMCDSMITRLQAKKFKYYNKHIPIEGGHTEPLKHFDLVFDFLKKNF